MIKEINRDIFLLVAEVRPATENDRQTGEDLLETLIAIPNVVSAWRQI